MKQYDGIKHTDDQSDAFWLAELLRLKILPVGYIYPKQQRQYGITPTKTTTSTPSHCSSISMTSMIQNCTSINLSRYDKKI